MRVINRSNELAPGVFGRHGFLVGEWCDEHAKYLEDAQFPMVTMEGDWGDFSFFNTCGRSIRWLRVSNVKKILGGIRNLPNLEVLSVAYEPRDIESLLDLPKLKNLEIVSKIPGVLASSRSLERLVVTGAISFDVRSENESLHELCLINPRIDAFRDISQFKNLEALEIFGAKELGSLGFLDRNHSLKTLRIESCPQLVDVSAMSSLRSLQRISIVRCPIGEIHKFSENSELEMLHVGGFPVTLKWCDIFCIKSLRRVVVLVDGDIADEGMILSALDACNRKHEKISIVGGKNKTVDVRLAA